MSPHDFRYRFEKISPHVGQIFQYCPSWLVKSKSMKAKYDKCEYIVKHKELKKVHNCEVCEYEFVGDDNLEKH